MRFAVKICCSADNWFSIKNVEINLCCCRVFHCYLILIVDLCSVYGRVSSPTKRRIYSKAIASTCFLPIGVNGNEESSSQDPVDYWYLVQILDLCSSCSSSPTGPHESASPYPSICIHQMHLDSCIHTLHQ